MVSYPGSRSSAQLHVFDTECRKTAEPTCTSFSFPNNSGSGTHSLFSEPCSHSPSPDELMAAPFYPDPSQRILAFDLGGAKLFVVNTEFLLELARKWQGLCVEWCEEWCTSMVSVQRSNISHHIWVSGCRLFRIVEVDGEPSYLQVYDFSPRSRAKNLNGPDGMSGGERKRCVSSGVGLYWLPWNLLEVRGASLTVGHDSMVFFVVSFPAILSTSLRSNHVFYCSVQSDDFASDLPGRMMHVWSV